MCSLWLHKHNESDIRKRNELQNEALGVWDEARFQNGRRRNYPAAFAPLRMPDTFLPTIFLSGLNLFLRLVNVHLLVLTQKVLLFVTLKSSEPGFVVEAEILERFSMAFTADGKRQRLPLIFYSFLVILK